MTSDGEYYDSHKDDEDEWGDPLPPRRTERRRLAAMVSVRFSPAEGEIVRQVAAARGVSTTATTITAGTAIGRSTTR